MTQSATVIVRRRHAAESGELGTTGSLAGTIPTVNPEEHPGLTPSFPTPNPHKHGTASPPTFTTGQTSSQHLHNHTHFFNISNKANSHCRLLQYGSHGFLSPRSIFRATLYDQTLLLPFLTAMHIPNPARQKACK